MKHLFAHILAFLGSLALAGGKDLPPITGARSEIPTQTEVLTLEKWKEYQATHKDTELTDLRVAGADCRCASSEVVDDWQVVIGELLRMVDPLAGPSWYKNEIEFGWIVTYQREPATPDETPGKLVELAVYLPNLEADYLDVWPKGRSGWTQPLRQAVPARGPQQAIGEAENYLMTLGIRPAHLKRRVAPVSKIAYIPVLKAERNKSGYSSILADAITIYVTEAPVLMLSRRECGVIRSSPK